MVIIDKLITSSPNTMNNISFQFAKRNASYSSLIFNGNQYLWISIVLYVYNFFGDTHSYCIIIRQIMHNKNKWYSKLNRQIWTRWVCLYVFIICFCNLMCGVCISCRQSWEKEMWSTNHLNISSKNINKFSEICKHKTCHICISVIIHLRSLIVILIIIIFKDLTFCYQVILLQNDSKVLMQI